jgi:hypothetical protein
VSGIIWFVSLLRADEVDRRERTMRFGERPLGFALLWFAILVVLMVWLYGVVYH